jgi:hypothetical protein
LPVRERYQRPDDTWALRYRFVVIPEFVTLSLVLSLPICVQIESWCS